MGNIINYVIGFSILIVAVFIIKRSFVSQIKGEGCNTCPSREHCHKNQ